MNATPSFTATILASVIELFRDEFEARLRPAYEGTITAAGAAPRETQAEVFNAFEHLSLACKNAAEADLRLASGESAEDAKKQALKNLSQAKRHLVTGRFFCIEHQILWTMEGILDQIERLPDGEAQSNPTYSERCAKLVGELGDAAIITIEPIEDPSEIEKAIRDFEMNHIEALTVLLVKFLRLADDLAEIVGPPQIERGPPLPPE
jgi:hypothetical protein